MAVDNQGKKYEYSGYGESVDVAAPGVDVVCKLPEGDEKMCSGTSIATAYVSGIASLILSTNKDLKSNEVADILKRNTKEVDSLQKYWCISVFERCKIKKEYVKKLIRNMYG